MLNWALSMLPLDPASTPLTNTCEAARRCTWSAGWSRERSAARLVWQRTQMRGECASIFQVEYGCQPESSNVGAAQAGSSPVCQRHCGGLTLAVDCADRLRGKTKRVRTTRSQNRS